MYAQPKVTHDNTGCHGPWKPTAVREDSCCSKKFVFEESLVFVWDTHIKKIAQSPSNPVPFLSRVVCEAFMSLS
jgi:hypothetical protein